MLIKSFLGLCIGLSVLSCSSGGSDTESKELDSVAVESEFAEVCTQDPFDGGTQGVYEGLYVDEYALSRCEFDVSITIETTPALNKNCSQRGTLRYTGTQTFVHPTDPRECGSVDEQVLFIWEPSNIDQATGDVASNINEYPIRVFMGFQELPPNRSESGLQLEQLIQRGWTYFNQNGNISFVAPENPEELYIEFIRQ